VKLKGRSGRRVGVGTVERMKRTKRAVGKGSTYGLAGSRRGRGSHKAGRYAIDEDVPDDRLDRLCTLLNSNHSPESFDGLQKRRLQRTRPRSSRYASCFQDASASRAGRPALRILDYRGRFRSRPATGPSTKEVECHSWQEKRWREKRTYRLV
jgi:hypothetical protein